MGGLHAHPFRAFHLRHGATANGLAHTATNPAPTNALAARDLAYGATDAPSGPANPAAAYRLLDAAAASRLAHRSLRLSPRPLGGHRRPPCGVSSTRLSRS